MSHLDVSQFDDELKAIVENTQSVTQATTLYYGLGEPVDGLWRGPKTSPLADMPEPPCQPEWRNITSEADEELIKKITASAATPIRSYSLRQLYLFGVNASNPRNLLSSAQFLHSELPVRFAQRIQYLNELPFGINRDEFVLSVRDEYVKAYKLITSFPRPESDADEVEFTRMIRYLLHRNACFNSARLSHAVCGGVGVLLRTLRTPQPTGGFGQRKPASAPGQPAPTGGSVGAGATERFLLQEYLDRFHVARLETRLLMAQHVAIHRSIPGYVGLFESKCNPKSVVLEAAAASVACMKELFGADVEVPEVQVRGAVDATLRYPRAHLHYMLMELLKNAMFADILWARHRKKLFAAHPELKRNAESKSTGSSSDGTPSARKILVIIADGEEDVVLKISDRAGGMPRSHTDLLWSYNYGPALAAAVDAEESLATGRAPYPQIECPIPRKASGFGLPMSRLIAQYMGGDLQIYSMHGHGTDAYLYLARLEVQGEIGLTANPVFTNTAPSHFNPSRDSGSGSGGGGGFKLQ